MGSQQRCDFVSLCPVVQVSLGEGQTAHCAVPSDPTSKELSVAIATPDKYNQMIDSAKAGGYAYPAVNVTSSQTLNAAIKGFADAESDGIIQVPLAEPHTGRALS